MITPPPDIGVSVAPLRKKRLSDEIYAQILLQLSTGQYKVGDRLPTEKEMASTYDVSRPVVREALQHLSNDGLIDARRGSGTFVSRLPPHEMAHHTDDARIAQYMRAYEVRRGLEVEAARLAALRIDQNHRRRIAHALSVMEDTMRGGEDALEADFQFHLEVARATENDLFEKQLMFLRPDMLGTMRIASMITIKRSDNRKEKVIQEHRDIFQAISAGDSELAKLYMGYHLISVRNRIIDQAN
ncbi:DNA-binding transcriptional regulator, FadR family [Paracoccus isoporae]|uniref:DNA-binding transcriptional regulator, FadR family n=1 Tax=Paracoccus isoporae TaxID=591205 RepID=A0A1G7DCS5_9RHOB|nr:FadR/GntR family transcriptional regulator [Paracoccus isoporae]SDE49347.1 DNA-binding transcriptional regulator, FadR family [Paracoccus isoporae]